MTEQTAEAPPSWNARMIGVVYLLYFVTSISGELLVRGMVLSNDAAATANNILMHGPLFRLHIAVGLIANALYIALTALFYGMFRPVNRSLALVAAFFSLVGCAIQAFASIFQVAPLAVLGGSSYLSAFNVAQLQALALLSLKLNGQATGVCLVFFGLFNVSVGYLIFRSTFLPRILGVLMVLSGFAWLTFLSPPFANRVLPGVEVVGILAEFALMLWLLVKGVNERRWRELARLSSDNSVSSS